MATGIRGLGVGVGGVVGRISVVGVVGGGHGRRRNGVGGPRAVRGRMGVNVGGGIVMRGLPSWLSGWRGGGRGGGVGGDRSRVALQLAVLCVDSPKHLIDLVRLRIDHHGAHSRMMAVAEACVASRAGQSSSNQLGFYDR